MSQLLQVKPEDLIVISNVRTNLPNIDELSASIKRRGQKVPMLVFNVKDNMIVLKDNLPVQKQKIQDTALLLEGELDSFDIHRIVRQVEDLPTLVLDHPPQTLHDGLEAHRVTLIERLIQKERKGCFPFGFFSKC